MKYNKGESKSLYELLATGSVSGDITPENIRFLVENITNKESCDKFKISCSPNNYARKIRHFEQIVARDLLKFYHKENKSSGLDAGYVYLISNPAWKEFKVGCAIDVYDRLKSYQTYSPYRDYSLEFYFFSFQRREDESKVLEFFNSTGEWISSPKEEIIAFMKTLAKYR